MNYIFFHWSDIGFSEKLFLFKPDIHWLCQGQRERFSNQFVVIFNFLHNICFWYWVKLNVYGNVFEKISYNNFDFIFIISHLITLFIYISLFYFIFYFTSHSRNVWFKFCTKIVFTNLNINSWKPVSCMLVAYSVYISWLLLRALACQQKSI